MRAVRAFSCALRRRLLPATLLLAVAAPVLAAPVKPPSEFLQRRHHMVVAARVAGAAEGHLRLVDVERLQGRDVAPVELSLRAPAWLASTLASGQRVVVGYTAYTMSQVSPETVVVNEDGPLLLTAPGMEPALFGDTAAARTALLDASGSDTARERAIAGLATHDTQWQNFFAHEVALRSAWHGALDAGDRRAIEALVRDADAHPSARAALLRVAASGRDPFGADWWVDAARDILARTPTTVPARADDTTAALVRSAFLALEAAEAKVPRGTLARWVAGDHAALAEQALLAARRFARDDEEPLARDALSRSLLATDTRVFLMDHLRRLELMRAAERAQARDD